MSESTWQESAVAAWRDHKASQAGHGEADAQAALRSLSQRLTVLGVVPVGSPSYADGVVRLQLQEGRPHVRHPDRPDEPATREVWACASGRTLWLEASTTVDGQQRLMHAGELATLADVGRALLGAELTPLQEDTEPSVADQLLMVLRALIDDALADAMEGRL